MSAAPVRRREAGFTLVELLVVLLILGILIAAGWAGVRSAKHKSRVRAMVTVTGSIDQAVSSFNRMYPPVGTPANDRLVSRAPGLAWIGTETEANGMYSPAGGKILRAWPEDPYGDGPVQVFRYRAGACPATAAPGIVAVCRVSAAAPGAYRIIGFARNSDGTVVRAYDKTRGA